MSDPPPSFRWSDRPLTVVEATLWAIGSVVALGLLVQTAQKLLPRLSSDIAVFSVCQILAYVVLLLVIRTVYFPRAKVSDVFGLGRGRWVFYPIAVVLGLSIHLPADGLYETILARWPSDATAADLLRDFHALPLWRKAAAGVGLVLTTPLVEEAFFRGALFGSMRRRYSAVPVLLSTAALFAFIHLEPQKYLPIGIVGASLALLRAASGSMWPGVLMHATFNGVTFYALTQTRAADTDEPIPRLWIIGGTVVSAGLLALCDHLRDRKADAAPLDAEGL